MKVKILPCRLIGEVKAPASKSMAHRLLICAGLSQGVSLIENTAFSQDILATLDCLEAMGAEIERGKDFVRIKGVSPEDIKDERLFPARESGSTLRFFIPLALLSSCRHSFTAYGRLPRRPMEPYERIAREKGLEFSRDEDGITVKGRLTSGEFYIRGDISSQFVSGLLFALPLCEGDSIIRLTGKIESRSYIDMTLWAMERFGVKAQWLDESSLFIKGSQKYISSDITVEGDYSNAAFLEAFNCIGSSLTVKGLSSNSLQGDRIYREYFRSLSEGKAELDVSDCPDLAPVLMTLGAMLNGAVLTGTARLRLKESDRGEAMRQELSRFGADITVNENNIIINKAPLHKPSVALDGHNDHRVVMALTVIASVYSGEITSAESVNKSYPDFFDLLRTRGLEAEIYDD